MNNCPDCNATGFQEDGKTPCETCSGKRYVQAPCRECNGAKQMEYEETCPDCKGSKQVEGNSKTCPDCLGDGNEYEEEYDGCSVCGSVDGRIHWFDVHKKVQTFTGSNRLSINGRSITLSLDIGMERESSWSKNFAQEWRGLEGMTVTLYGNEIAYKGGFAHSHTDATWDITFVVRTAGTPADSIVASYFTGASDSGNKNFDFEGWLKVNTAIIEETKLDNGNKENQTYTFMLKDLPMADKNSTVTFTSHRYKYVWGFKIKAARGPELTIYPYGK